MITPININVCPSDSSQIMTDINDERTASDSLLLGRGYTPDYGINESVTVSGSLEASEKQPRPSAIKTALSSSGSERVYVVAMCSMIACLASIVNGMMLGFSSPALTQLQFNVSENLRINSTDIRYSLFGVRRLHACSCIYTV